MARTLVSSLVTSADAPTAAEMTSKTGCPHIDVLSAMRAAASEITRALLAKLAVTRSSEGQRENVAIPDLHTATTTMASSSERLQ